MIYTAWIEPYSLTLGVVSGAAPCFYWAWERVNAQKQISIDREKEVRGAEDELSDQMLEYAHRRERVEESLGHLQYKIDEANRKIKDIEEIKERLRDKEQKLVEQEEFLGKKEIEMRAQLRKKDGEIKGARGRANRLRSQKDAPKKDDFTSK